LRRALSAHATTSETVPRDANPNPTERINSAITLACLSHIQKHHNCLAISNHNSSPYACEIFYNQIVFVSMFSVEADKIDVHDRATDSKT
jgi:hypothetical protein